MAKQQGWISLHRQIQEHWLWEEKPFSKGQAWIDLLMLANHQDVKIPYKGKIITCKAGTVNRSIMHLAERWGWSRDKTRKFLNLLESDGMVKVNATKHRTTITIENYTKYTIYVATNRQQIDNRPTTDRQQTDINNNDNNDNNDNKYIEQNFKGVEQDEKECESSSRKTSKHPTFNGYELSNITEL